MIRAMRIELEAGVAVVADPSRLGRSGRAGQIGF